MQFAKAQDIVKTTPALIERPLFIGGNIVIGGGSGWFQLGLNPELSKRMNQWVDIGGAVNLLYSASNPNFLSSTRTRSFQFGVGGFTRIWPAERFFLQVQPEYNWNWTNMKDMSTNSETSGASRKIRYGAESILAGIGYGSRSEHGMTYFTLMIDLLKNPNSPYRDGYNRADPFVKAGFALPIRSKH
ncbi:MAG: hypothetical protein KA534_03165 [Sediminibacterium sp.]|nr:hypothetical protein [Sediminibacterium sp.]MBP6144727.1 hypothetical protein [Sediminibacterium sp.]